MRHWLFLLLSALPATAQSWSVSPDPAWERCLRRSWGWSGADGAYSVRLGGGWSGWVFSDTFVGQVYPDGRRDPDSLFLNNSWARIQRDRPALAVFSHRPLVESPRPHWFWVHQPILGEDRRGHMFLAEFRKTEDGPEGLNFTQVGTRLARLDWSALAPRLSHPLPVPHYRDQLNFGAAVLEQGDTLYLYASRDRGLVKEALLARVARAELERFEQWRFYTGQDWSAEVDRAAPILGEAANEFSVYAEGAEFRLLAQVGAEIRLHRGLRPEGPWSEPVVLYRIPDEPGGLHYNAKVHPELGRPLLITYNSNALPPELVIEQASRYRPRCLRLYGDPWSRPRSGDGEPERPGL